jgi:hypothetical protein
MTVAQTSIQAYKEHQAAGKVGKQSQYILDTMMPGRTYSRRELAIASGLELSSVCGRVNELLQIGLVSEASPRRCTVTGKTVSPVVRTQQITLDHFTTPPSVVNITT